MALITGRMKQQMKTFIKTANQTKQTDLDKSIDDFCKQLEESVYAAIKSLTITLPPGFIVVAGSATTQTNALPIVIQMPAVQFT